MRLAAILPALLVVLPSQAQTVAMVMDAQGDTQWTSGVLPATRLPVLAELKAGDRLALSKGATVAWITFQGGEQLTVKGPASLTLGGDGHPQPKVPGLEARPVKALKLKEGLKPGGLAQASLVMRGPKDDFALTAPAAPVVLTLESFAWEVQGTGATYHLQVREEGGPVCLETRTSATQVPAPKGLFHPGKAYTWIVTCTAGDGTRTESAGRVELLSLARREALEAARPGPGADFAARLLYAALLEQFQLTDLAKVQWKALARERKGDDVLEGYAQ